MDERIRWQVFQLRLRQGVWFPPQTSCVTSDRAGASEGKKKRRLHHLTISMVMTGEGRAVQVYVRFSPDVQHAPYSQ